MVFDVEIEVDLDQLIQLGRRAVEQINTDQGDVRGLARCRGAFPVLPACWILEFVKDHLKSWEFVYVYVVILLTISVQETFTIWNHTLQKARD